MNVVCALGPTAFLSLDLTQESQTRLPSCVGILQQKAAQGRGGNVRTEKNQNLQGSHCTSLPTAAPCVLNWSQPWGGVIGNCGQVPS